MEETLQEALAIDYLDALMADYVMKSGAPAKTADVARVVSERVGASARLVRNELSRSARLTLVERRWDLRLRHDTRHRSVDGTILHLLRDYGKPVSLAQLAHELGIVRGRSRDEQMRVVAKLVDTRGDTYFQLPDGTVGLREWLLDVSPDDDDETVRRLNFLRTDLDLDALVAQMDLVAAQEAKTAVDGLVALISSVEEPVANRLLFYALWRARGCTDLLPIFAKALHDERVALVGGPAWVVSGYLEQLAGVLLDLSAKHDAEATGTDEVDLQEILESEVPADEEFQLGPDDLQELQRVITEAGRSMALPQVVSDVFELFPGDLQYAAAVRLVSEALTHDDRFVSLPDNHWHLRVLMPATLFRLPVTLQLSPIEVTNLTGEPFDALLTDAGLDGGLEWEVRAPDLEDVGEEDEVPALREGVRLSTRQRFVTSYRHFVSGTTKVRAIDRGVLPREPALRPIPLIDNATGEQFELWLNNQTGLLCGLDEWYKGRLQPAGHVFHIEWDEAESVWRVDIEDEPDAAQFIPQARLDELLVMRVKIEHAQDVSVLEIMRQLMDKHPAGVSFRRLYTECNIVRRVSKRTIASNLSSYPMFTVSDDETLWLYDERKASRPRDPAKRAFLVEAEAGQDTSER